MAHQAAWSVKLDRAQEHIETLRVLVAQYSASEPVQLIPESTEDPSITAYRLKFRSPVPDRVAPICGDVLHNLRSALDSLVFAMATEAASRRLSTDEEKESFFPISKDSQDFDRKVRRSAALRLLSEPAKAALRVHQPWYLTERGVEGLSTQELAIVRARDVDEWWVSRLHGLNIIDKHRRLAVAAWWPDLLYWTGSSSSTRHLRPGDGTLEDDSVLCYMVGDDPDGSDLQHEFQLVLKDDPSHSPADRDYSPRSCVDLLQAWWTNAGYLVRAVEQRVEGLSG